MRIDVEVGRAKLSLLRAGPEGGEPVLLLHGMPTGAELWRGVLGRLAEAGFAAWAPDLPGYGHTRLPPGDDRSLAAAADLLAAWLEGAGSGPRPAAPLWLVGHDLGGAVAQILVTRRPDLVARLTLGDTVVEDSWPVTPIRLFRTAARLGLYPLLAATRLVPNPYAWWELRRGFSNPARLDRDTARRVVWDGKVSDPEGRREFARHLKALDSAQTVAVAPHLREIGVPVLLVWGEDDRFQTWEEVGRRLEALLPEPDTEVLGGGGHFLPLERPRAYTQALLRWRQAG